LAATGANVYALSAGNSLPSGLGLSSGGLLSGNIAVQQDTVYSFSVEAIDTELQESPRTFSLTIAIPPADPYFEYVSLLLNDSGANTAQNNTFLDSSATPKEITRNGDTTQGSFSPFSRPDGRWSTYFNNSGRLALGNNSALLPGSGQFTVETWFNAGAFGTGFGGPENFSSNGNNCIFSYGAYGNFLRLFLAGSTPNLLLKHGQDNLLNVNVSATVKVGGWNHVAIVRNSSNNIIVYLNGVAIGSPVANTTDFNGNLSIGADAEQLFFFQGTYQGAPMNWTGYISNFRVVKGTAVYTGNFTPSTSPLTAIANTGVLTCQSNRFKDNSTNNFAITVSGNPSVQVFDPFNPAANYTTATNGGSGYFDNSGDYLSAPSNAAFALGTGNFTWEAWVYPTSFDATYEPIYLNNVTGGLWIGKNGANFVVRASGVADQLQYSVMPPTNVWTHIVAVRSGTTLSLYYNGVRVATTTNSYDFQQGVAIVASDLPAGGSDYFNGYISSLRLVKGTAVYDPTQTTLTVPTAPVTAISDTSLLLNFTNGGIFDSAAMNDLVTVGNAQVRTDVKKYGTGSIYFDGTGDQLNLPSSQNYAFGTGDYTIELWLRLNTATASYPTVWSITSTFNGGTDILGMLFGDAGYGYYLGYYDNGNFTSLSSSGITQSSFLNTWKHVAFVRASGSLKIYVDGTAVYTAASSTNMTGPYFMQIGARNGYGINGYIDDFRITKGYARYTANFTPPDAAFPDF
jgi:hypothetical protein